MWSREASSPPSAAPRLHSAHFDNAIQILNWRILPALKFSPKELLLNLIVNTKPTPLEASSSVPTSNDFDTHTAYANQQQLDGYSEAIRHAMDRKRRFDRRVIESAEGEVIFKKGQLVQIYRSDLAKSISSERKLAPMWSEPHRVLERLLNSYKLETLTGELLEGEYHARRLREFIPREGTDLAIQQKEVEARETEDLDITEEINTTTRSDDVDDTETQEESGEVNNGESSEHSTT